jgi:N-acetylmuramoyl-L-alanine amidase
MANRSINLIVIHCAATPSGKSIGPNPAATIDAWHQARGFHRDPSFVRTFNPDLPHIGYHFVIGLDGAVITGRHLDEIGAHAYQFNSHSIGICLVGGAERDGRYTAEQWEALARLVIELTARLRIPVQPARRVHKAASPGYDMVMGVCGHRDLSPDKNGNGLAESFEWLKTCPGFDVRAWLGNGLIPEPGQIIRSGA